MLLIAWMMESNAAATTCACHTGFDRLELHLRISLSHGFQSPAAVPVSVQGLIESLQIVWENAALTHRQLPPGSACWRGHRQRERERSGRGTGKETCRFTECVCHGIPGLMSPRKCLDQTQSQSSVRIWVRGSTAQPSHCVWVFFISLSLPLSLSLSFSLGLHVALLSFVINLG